MNCQNLSRVREISTPVGGRALENESQSKMRKLFKRGTAWEGAQEPSREAWASWAERECGQG